MNRLPIVTVFLVAAWLASAAHSFGAEDAWTGGWRRITGPGGMPVLPQDLSVGDVRHMMEHYVEWEYGGRLRIGIVTARDDDSIIVELVTPDGYAVQFLEVDRHTGWMRPSK